MPEKERFNYFQTFYGLSYNIGHTLHRMFENSSAEGRGVLGGNIFLGSLWEVNSFGANLGWEASFLAMNGVMSHVY